MTKDNYYLKELESYLEHCKNGGYPPRIGYIRFLKQFCRREEIEFQKIMDRVFNSWYYEIEEN